MYLPTTSMNKILFTALISALVCMCLPAQTDTTIYQIAEEMPRFPVCEGLDTTLEFKTQCSQQQLMAFMSQNIVYPYEARMNGNEGTVVLSFVIEKDGSLTNPRIVKDVGGGCGLEALRIINALVEQEVKWVPGKNKGQPVRTQFTLPVRFRLQEAPPYEIIGMDTVYTRLDEPLEYIGGQEALFEFLNSKLQYPPSGNDSCLIGTIDIQLLVDRRGNVRILDLTDYNALGSDFWYAAINAVTSTAGKWKVATLEGKKVPSAYNVSLSFVPERAACKAKIDKYQQAATLAAEGAELFNNGEQDAGIAKISRAIELFPNDANFLYMRGQAYLEMNRFAEACADLTLMRSLALVNWFDTLLPVICSQGK